MKLIKAISVVLMALAAGVSVWFVDVAKPTGIGAYVFFAGWLLSPYLILGALLISLRAAWYFYLAASIVSLGGILLIADVIFWHKDAQGAIAIFLVPILQAAAFLVLCLLGRLLVRQIGGKSPAQAEPPVNEA